MTDHSKDFGLHTGHTWLNAASEGPIPKVAAQALEQAIGWKLSPHQLTIPKFQQVPIELKKSLARLIHVSPEDIILGNSATYGIHLLANGLPLGKGDEIVLMNNDFPTDILPWLSLKKKGVVVHQVKAKHFVLAPEEILASINKNTKVLCISYIHSFSGWGMEVAAIGRICRDHGILCVVNLSQAAGAFPVNVGTLGVDAIVCAGYKWLLGPYGTGFCWMTKETRERLDYPQNYWISLMDAESLEASDELTLTESHASTRYDVFGTANFFNFVPWRASIDYLLNIGLDQIHTHNSQLIDSILNNLDKNKFQLISPVEEKKVTNILVFSHKISEYNTDIFEVLKSKGFYLGFWKGNLRISPHIYNTPSDINNFLTIINSYAK